MGQGWRGGDRRQIGLRACAREKAGNLLGVDGYLQKWGDLSESFPMGLLYYVDIIVKQDSLSPR
jgi:hypothetical protein